MRIALLALLVLASAAVAGTEADRLAQVYEQTGDLQAQVLSLRFRASDHRIDRIDRSAQEYVELESADPAAAQQIGEKYGAEVETRAALLHDALEYLFPPHRRLPSGSVVSLDDPIFDDASLHLGEHHADQFLARIGGGVYLTEPFRPGVDVVLFLHGMGGTPRDFHTLIGSVDRSRYQVWVGYYPTGELVDPSADLIRRGLADVLARFPARRVVVVTHSLGGIVLRRMAPLPPAVRAVYFLCGPHHGVRFMPITLVRLAFRVLYRFFPPFFNDLLEGSAFLTQLNAQPPLGATVRSLSGDTRLTWQRRLSGQFIPGTNDGLVPLDSTFLAGETSHVTLHEDHFTILDAGATSALVAGWLAQDLTPGR